MKYSFLIFICSLIFLTKSFGQSVIEESIKKERIQPNQLELRSGLLVFDLFEQEGILYEGDFRSYFLSVDVMYQRSLFITDQLAVNLGGGYSYFYTISPGGNLLSPPPGTDYARDWKQNFSNIKMILGLRYQPIDTKNIFNLDFNGYYLINKVVHNRDYSRRFFATIDLSYQRLIKENIGFLVYMPIGIKPPFEATYALVGDPFISPWIGISGLGVGLTYYW